jgi:hypothetical protein
VDSTDFDELDIGLAGNIKRFVETSVMSRAQPKSSPTDQHARRIASAIAKGRRPALTPNLDLYLESCPHEIFAALEGVARHMPPAGKDEALALGYLFLLQGLLEHLRYRTDRGYADAARLIADFQAEVAAQVGAGHIDGHVLAHLAGALHQSKIPASPELTAASAGQRVDDDEGGPFPGDIRAALEGFLKVCDGDPFVLVGSLVEFGHAVPTEARAALAAGLAHGGPIEARGAAVLFLLDPDPVVRRAVAGALAGVASTLSPTEVRRLIAVRNWRPIDERTEVDAIIRKARAAGVDCAQWEAGSAETILATAVDGSVAQGFLLVSPAGRKKRISSILTKGGIADAWSGEPEPRRRVEATLADSSMNAPMLRVSRSYLDSILAHHLALSVEKGELPPLGLLQVAETIGGADWQPALMNFSDTLAQLIAELPEAMRGGTAFETVLRKSGELADLEAVAQSWFEDGPDIAQAISGARGRNRAKLATYLLQIVIARHRDKWAALFLRTALWMREAPSEFDLCWRELVIVAKALADGRDMSEIGLMREIAQRTVAVLTDDARI